MNIVKNIYLIIIIIVIPILIINCEDVAEFKEIKSKPNLVYPTNNELFVEKPLKFTWENVKNADYYEIFLNGNLMAKLAGNINEIDSSDWDIVYGDYTWYVRAVNEFQYMHCENPFQFSFYPPEIKIEIISPTTIGQEENRYSLSDDYPCGDKEIKIKFSCIAGIDKIAMEFSDNTTKEFFNSANETEIKKEIEITYTFTYAELKTDNISFSFIASDILMHKIFKFEFSMDIFRETFFSDIQGYGKLKKPVGLAFDSTGNLIIADADAGRFINLDKNGNYIDSWFVSTSFTTSSLQDITYNPSNNTIIFSILNCLDFKSGIIGIQDLNHQVISKMEAEAPIGLAIENDILYVAEANTYGEAYDIKNNSSKGRIGDNDFTFTDGVVLFDKYVFISDSLDNSIKIYYKDSLRFNSEFKPKSPKFQLPKGMAIDKKNRLYVVNKYLSKVILFQVDASTNTPSFTYISEFGEDGYEDNGPRFFNGPTWIEIDEEGYIYISDTENHRVQKTLSSSIKIY